MCAYLRVQSNLEDSRELSGQAEQTHCGFNSQAHQRINDGLIWQLCNSAHFGARQEQGGQIEDNQINQGECNFIFIFTIFR